MRRSRGGGRITVTRRLLTTTNFTTDAQGVTPLLKLAFNQQQIDGDNNWDNLFTRYKLHSSAITFTYGHTASRVPAVAGAQVQTLLRADGQSLTWRESGHATSFPNTFQSNSITANTGGPLPVAEAGTIVTAGTLTGVTTHVQPTDVVGQFAQPGGDPRIVETGDDRDIDMPTFHFLNDKANAIVDLAVAYRSGRPLRRTRLGPTRRTASAVSKPWTSYQVPSAFGTGDELTKFSYSPTLFLDDTSGHDEVLHGDLWVALQGSKNRVYVFDIIQTFKITYWKPFMDSAIPQAPPGSAFALFNPQVAEAAEAAANV